MKLTIDTKYNVAYLKLQEGSVKSVKTVSLSEDLNIDLAEDGSVYGIELLNAREQVDLDKLVIVDKVRAVEKELSLT